MVEYAGCALKKMKLHYIHLDELWTHDSQGRKKERNALAAIALRWENSNPTQIYRRNACLNVVLYELAVFHIL